MSVCARAQRVVGRRLVGLAVGIALAVVALQADRAPHADQTKSGGAMRWYDAYDQGVKAVGAQEWDQAERWLTLARSGGPEQGWNVLFVGEDYRPFIPDYYLGVVQLRTGRFAQAEAAFASVRSRRLIDPKNRLASALDQQAKEATAGRIAAEAAPKAPPPQAQVQEQTPPVSQITPPTVNPDLSTGRGPAPLPGRLGSQTQTPIGQTVNLPTFPPGSGRTGTDAVTPGTPSNTTPGTGRTGRTTQAPSSQSPPSQTPSTPPPVDDAYGLGVPITPDTRFADGVRQFLGGDYAAAVRVLEQADQSPTASPRVKIYLACAYAALVLTGRKEPQTLAMARQLYADGDPDRNLREDDRALISPRVLDRLRRP